MSDKFRQRCHSLLSYKSKFFTFNNWKYGVYAKRILTTWNHSTNYFQSTKFQHLLQMTKDTILLSDIKSGFYAINRTKYGKASVENWIFEKCFPRVRDIFPCNDVIITNHIGGSIRQWTVEWASNGQIYFNTKILKNRICADTKIRDDGYITGTDYIMDVTPQHIALGSNNGEIKIWKYIGEENAITEENAIFQSKLPFQRSDVRELNSIAFDPTGTKLATGYFFHSSDFRSTTVTCTIYDINKRYTKADNNFDTQFCINYNGDFNRLLWEDPNFLLISGSSGIKKVDVRTHNVVHTWESPITDLTCISTDNQYAIMTGTWNAGVILWDQRQSTLVQEYKIPRIDYGWLYKVECLQFDNSHLYIVADKFYELDFYNSA